MTSLGKSWCISCFLAWHFDPKFWIDLKANADKACSVLPPHCYWYDTINEDQVLTSGPKMVVQLWPQAMPGYYIDVILYQLKSDELFG